MYVEVVGKVVENFSFNSLDFPPPGEYNGQAEFTACDFPRVFWAGLMKARFS